MASGGGEGEMKPRDRLPGKAVDGLTFKNALCAAEVSTRRGSWLMRSRCRGRRGGRGLRVVRGAEGDVCLRGEPSGGRQRARVQPRVSGHAHLEALQVSGRARERLQRAMDALPQRAAAWTSQLLPNPLQVPLPHPHYMSPGRSLIDQWAPGSRN